MTTLGRTLWSVPVYVASSRSLYCIGRSPPPCVNQQTGVPWTAY